MLTHPAFNLEPSNLGHDVRNRQTPKDSLRTAVESSQVGRAIFSTVKQNRTTHSGEVYANEAARCIHSHDMLFSRAVSTVEASRMHVSFRKFISFHLCSLGT